MSFSTSISSVMPDHWSLTDKNETCSIKTLDSARPVGFGLTQLCWCVRTAKVAVVSKPQSYCHIFVSSTGLYVTQLDSVGVYAPLVSDPLVTMTFPSFSKTNTKCIWPA